MRRILGLDRNGFWHLASVTYTATMHTQCNKWLQVVAFAIENPTDASIPPTNAPWCTSCVFTLALKYR